ncbi:MAG: molybdate ABC transporter substrate-binding protein [Acidobacteriota bacterium]
MLIGGIFGAALMTLFSVAPPPKTTPAASRQVRVAAAADLKFALDEVTSKFRAVRPDIEVTITYGSSGNFYSQLSNRAPYDLFLSADAEYPRKLIEAGLAVRGSDFLYARGRIVLWVRKDSTLDIEKRGLDALLDPSVRKIAIANPRHAPYGRAAEAAMKSSGIYDRCADRMVLGENIAQTAQFIESGAADAGLIALSLAVAPAMRDQGRFWTVPREAHPPVDQGGAILTWASHAAAAGAFKDFLIGESGRAILDRYGFERPGR